MDFRHRNDIPGHTPQNEQPVSAGSSAFSDAGQMVIGREVVISGEISNCADLLVEGIVKATLKDGQNIEITETGRFDGTLEVLNAEISGIFEGQLTVKNRLVLRPTAQIKGDIFYGVIEVHPGARIEGQMTGLELPQEEPVIVEEPQQQAVQVQPSANVSPLQQPAAPNVAQQEVAFDMDNIINRINGDDDGEGEKTLPFRNVANG